MIKFKVNLKGLDKGRRLTIDKIKKILMKSMFKMEELAIDKAPFDTGFLRQNITLFPQILAAKYHLVSTAPYSADLEYGNTPRNVKHSDIAKWIERKGIRTTAGGVAAFTNYVVNKIKREGVNAQPFMRPALHDVNSFWIEEVAKQEFKNSSI